MPLINTAIVTPFAFPFQISPRQMIRIAGIKNPWDRDVALKKALGLTEDILFAAAGMLQSKTSTQQSSETK